MDRLLKLFILTWAVLVGLGTMACNKLETSRVTVTAPDAVEIVQEGDREVIVKITRFNFDANVTILFDNIPRGVSVLGDTIPKGKDEGKFLLQATEAAKPGEHEISITTKGVAVPNTIKFKLFVTKGVQSLPHKKYY